MQRNHAVTGLLGPRRLGACAVLVAICCLLCPGVVSGQQAKKGNTKAPIEDTRIAINHQEVIARLFGVSNELKGEADKPAAALLQAEVGDVLWRFDEPAARSIFRLAFDTVRQTLPNDSSSPLILDRKSKSEAVDLARRRANAIRKILKLYGLHDRKGSEAWLQEFENDVKAEAERTTSGSSDRMSPEQAELLAALGIGPDES